jgi:hypothetical protein
MNEFSLVSRVPRHLLFLLVFLLAAALPAGCSPSPRVMVEKYLEGKQAKDTSATETSTEDKSSCPEALSVWLDETQETGRSSKGSGIFDVLAVYTVSGDSIALLELPSVTEKLVSWQQDEALHQQIWNHITQIIPTTYRENVTRLVFFSDGPEGSLGAVEQTSQPGEWTLAVDIQDGVELPTLAATLIHETAHLFSLGTTQVETNLPLFEHPEDGTLFDQGKAACDTYFIREGCSLPGSYLNLFFEQFWGDLYDEWTGIQLEEDIDSRTYQLTKLHSRHADEFVSTYAVTSPEEDLAESFLYFVLSADLTGASVADEKVSFFQQFPDLFNLRQQMRTNLCTIWEP